MWRLLFVLLVAAASLTLSDAYWTCTDAQKAACKNEPSEQDCKGLGRQRLPEKCCIICRNSPNEKCGGEFGICGKNLTCVSSGIPTKPGECLYYTETIGKLMQTFQREQDEMLQKARNVRFFKQEFA